MVLKHKNSDKLTKEVRPGQWNWMAFLFGPFYYFWVGMWGEGFVYFLLVFLFWWTLIVPLVVWIFMGYMFEGQYFEYLLARGYVENEEAK